MNQRSEYPTLTAPYLMALTVRVNDVPAIGNTLKYCLVLVAASRGEVLMPLALIPCMKAISARILGFVLCLGHERTAISWHSLSEAHGTYLHSTSASPEASSDIRSQLMVPVNVWWTYPGRSHYNFQFLCKGDEEEKDRNQGTSIGVGHFEGLRGMGYMPEGWQPSHPLSHPVPHHAQPQSFLQDRSWPSAFAPTQRSSHCQHCLKLTRPMFCIGVLKTWK